MQKDKYKDILISVIIPAYRQEKTIQPDIINIHNALSQLRHSYEIIVVVDGDVDRTFLNAQKVKLPHVRVFGYKDNHGKGFAIRYGMAKARGDIIGFIDSGMDLNPNGLSMLLEQLEWYDADIIIGSKRHMFSKVNYPLVRRIVSFLAQIWIRILFGLRVRDTQVGMKFFKRKVIQDVLPRLLVKKFAFDIEILAIANRLGYSRIYEAPIELDFNYRSTVSQSLLNALVRTFIDTLAIFYRLKILKYYDNSSKKKWKYDPELGFRKKDG